MFDATKDLGLSEKTTSGGGCACCSTASSGAESSTVSPVETVLQVEGMTCEHCVASVTEELSALPGVNGIAITLRVGGASTVTVESAAPLDSTAVASAIDEAGYSIVSA